MAAKLLSVVVLATSVLAHPNHKRHNHLHQGTGTGNGWAMPTGGAYPLSNGTSVNGTDFGGSAIESPSSSSVLATATGILTVTISPVPADASSPGTGAIATVSTAIAVPSSSAVAATSGSSSGSSGGSPAGGSSGGAPQGPPDGSGEGSCSILTSTITSTSVQYVTVTATGGSGSEVARTGGADQFSSASGQSEGPGGFYGASSSSMAGGFGGFGASSSSMTSGFGASSSSMTSGIGASSSSMTGGFGGFGASSSSITSSIGVLASSTASISVGSASAGQFFPHPSQQTSYPAGGASSSAAFSYGGGASSSAGFSFGGGAPSSAMPTTFATISSGAPSSSVAATASWGTPSSSPSSSPSTGGSSSGKKGLSFNTASLTNAFAGKGISWAYNWGASPDGTILSGAEYVPMLWGTTSVSAWASAAAAAIEGGAQHALSFNEPDLSTQSAIDPATAAQLHIANMNPLAGQVQIGSPAVTNGAGTNPLMGIDWLNAFFKACAGQCKVDFVAFHWYDSASNLAYFKSHVNDVIAAAQQNGVSKVWLTEFGATGSDSDVASFIGEATSFLDSTAAVERYAYFMCSDGILVNGNSISSPVGAAYA